MDQERGPCKAPLVCPDIPPRTVDGAPASGNNAPSLPQRAIIPHDG
jgi:hypothetical protein